MQGGAHKGKGYILLYLDSFVYLFICIVCQIETINRISLATAYWSRACGIKSINE